jgi:hypothetical protein
LRQGGLESESIAAYIQWRKLAGDPQPDIDVLRQTYREAGWQSFDEQRHKILKARLEALRSKEKAPEPLSLAAAYAAIGDRDSAFQYLEQAYSNRNPRLTWIKSSLDWDPLRNDPRYHNLIRRMNLPD